MGYPKNIPSHKVVLRKSHPVGLSHENPYHPRTG